MKQNDYYRGHLITTDGKWYIAHHGASTLRAQTRKGIELLIASVAGDTTFYDLVDYHLRRTIELCTGEFGYNPTDEEANKLLIQLKRCHAKLIEMVWTQSK